MIQLLFWLGRLAGCDGGETLATPARQGQISPRAGEPLNILHERMIL